MYLIISSVWFIILSLYLLFFFYNTLTPIFFSFPVSIVAVKKRKVHPKTLFQVLIAPIIWTLVTLGLHFFIKQLALKINIGLFSRVIFGSTSRNAFCFILVAYIISLLLQKYRNSIKEEYYHGIFSSNLTNSQIFLYTDFSNIIKTSYKANSSKFLYPIA